MPRETETLPFTERPRLIEGTVGLVSTVPDYLRFCQMLLNRGELGGVRLIKPETAALMTTNGLSAEIMKVRGGAMGWALGNAVEGRFTAILLSLIGTALGFYYGRKYVKDLFG